MRPLSDPLALRSTTAWPEYASVATLPVAIGRTTLAPVQYDTARRLWVVSDYPVSGVDAVRIDDVATADWRWRNDRDATGRTIAFLELGQALPDGAVIAVDVRGLPDPETGGLLDNPADVARWVLSTYAGRTVSRASMDRFRTAAVNAGLSVGGVLSDAGQTIRSCLDGLFRSVGAVWSGGMPGIAALYPASRPAEVPLSAVFPSADDGFTATASAGRIATAVEFRYHYDHAAGTYLGTVRAEAPDAIVRYGRVDLVWEAPWLTDSSAAIALATRVLQYRARPQWVYQWRTPLTVVGGDWVSANQWLAPVSGEVFVTGAERNLAAGETTLTAEVAAGAAPRVTVTQISGRLKPVIPDAIVAELRGGTLTITVPSVTGAPIAGAKVTLDGQQAQVTDALGRCQFYGVQAGRHQIRIEADGYQPMDYGLTV